MGLKALPNKKLGNYFTYLPERNKADFSVLTKFLVIIRNVTDYTAGPHVYDLPALFRGHT